MWKQIRLDLAKGEDRNKAGRKLGRGTTSHARRLKRIDEVEDWNWNAWKRDEWNPHQEDEVEEQEQCRWNWPWDAREYEDRGWLNQPLEKGEARYTGMRLTKEGPSWMWKQLRIDLAKGEDRNKAGRKLGQGTTSRARRLKRIGKTRKDQPALEDEVEDWNWNAWKRDEWNPHQEDEVEEQEQCRWNWPWDAREYEDRGWLNQPLEKGEARYTGMRLTKEGPSWMWKQLRIDLAKGEDRNKAGRKLGQGTTSRARRLKRIGKTRKDQPALEDEVEDWNWHAWKRDAWDSDDEGQ